MEDNAKHKQRQNDKDWIDKHIYNLMDQKHIYALLKIVLLTF